MPVSLPDMNGISVTDFRAPHLSSSYDLLFNVTPGDGGLAVNLEYDPDIFDAATATRWLEGYRALLEGVAGDSDASIADLPVMPASGLPGGKRTRVRDQPIGRAPRSPRPAPGV
jgi:hypothetical protein